MKGHFKMLLAISLLSIFGLVRSSGVGHIEPVGDAPIVTSASSQYFERTFNRLVVPQPVEPAPVQPVFGSAPRVLAPAPPAFAAAPVFGPAPPVVAPVFSVGSPPVQTVFPVGPPPVQPVFPIGPPPIQQVFPIASVPPVFVESAKSAPVPSNPPPTQQTHGEPNVAIAVATAHAAPVATILLPPYPFGLPPNFGFVPAQQPTDVLDSNSKESTTQSSSTTQTEATTTTKEPESTTPIPSSSDDNFVQALPSNEDVNFRQYGPPLPPQQSELRPQFQPRPQPQQPRPQFLPSQPQQPRAQFQPSPQRPQFQPQPQRPQFQPQPQRPQFQPPPQLQLPQFQPQTPLPQYLPPPQPQQPRPQFQPNPQQLRPQFQPRPQQASPQYAQRPKPQKLKTSIEVVPVPLAYIAPPSISKHHHHHHPHHAHIKVVKHVYTYVPASSKIFVKPVKVRSVPLKLVAYRRDGNTSPAVKAAEPTTSGPFPRPSTKPPRL